MSDPTILEDILRLPSHQNQTGTWYKSLFKVQDDTDDSFAAIIAVLPDTPPNCIVVQVGESSLEVLQMISHKSGVRNNDLNRSTGTYVTF